MFVCQVLPPSAPPSPDWGPQDLLCRIQGVVTDMEKSVADERQRSPGPQFACLACNCALTSDASYCDRCGRRQAVAEGPDLVRNLGERLENLQTQREAAEQRAEQLASLRKIVSEGRHQHMTHYLSLSDGGFAAAAIAPSRQEVWQMRMSSCSVLCRRLRPTSPRSSPRWAHHVQKVDYMTGCRSC
ncbi:unnamed protein product [Effrenium voratum]|nr:unnamed protein product [Effrenium voratum]